MPEVIPEAVLIVGAFFLFVCALILRGLLASYNYSLGSAFSWLATHLRVRIPLPFHKGVTVNFGSPFGVLNDVIVQTMQAGIRDTEKYLAYTWHAAEKLLRYTTEAIDYLARETAQTFEWLANVKLPKWAKVLLAGAFPVGLLTRLIAQAVQHLRPTVIKTVKVIEHAIPGRIVQVFKFAGAAVLPGVLGLPKIRGDITNLWKWRTKAEKRLHKVEGLFAAGVFAAVLANALGVATRCIRRGNLGKTARSVCGMDGNLLDSLLTDALAIVGVLSVVEFANELRAVEDEALSIMGKLVREFPG